MEERWIIFKITRIFCSYYFFRICFCEIIRIDGMVFITTLIFFQILATYFSNLENKNQINFGIYHGGKPKYKEV